MIEEVILAVFVGGPILMVLAAAYWIGRFDGEVATIRRLQADGWLPDIHDVFHVPSPRKG
jgi:hypothetical protein